MKYFPKGVMNVVNLAVSGSSGIYQKPEAVSNLENTKERCSWCTISSTVGIT